jgi:hypothetical protein
MSDLGFLGSHLFAGWSLLGATAPACSTILLLTLLPWRRPARQNRKSPVRKRTGFSGYTFAIGMALQNLEKLIHHNVQPMVVQVVDEDQDEDDQTDSNDPQVLFHRQLKKIRRGEPLDQLVLRVRRG